MNPEPLTDSDLERLSDVLRTLGAKHAMNAEQIDGFIAAIVCFRENIPERVYLPVIWGDDMVNEDTFATQPKLQDFLGLITRHKNATENELKSGVVYTPLLLPDEGGVYRANDWANGFLRGMSLRKAEWSTLLEDEDHGGSLVPILTLAHENDPDPKMRPYTEPMTAERRESLILGVAVGVMRIYKYFRNQGEMPHFDNISTTYRRIAPKTGRNEPCPCGSGKKYKHCCGKITLH